MPADPKQPLFWVAPILLVCMLGVLWVTRATPAPPSLRADVVQQQPSLVRVLLAGDMMFDRSVRTAMRTHGDDVVFSCIDNTLRGADLVVANLEGPITDNDSLSEGSVPDTPANYTFTFAPEVAKLLYRHNIRLVNLGNNHILNWGAAGEEATKTYLDNAGVAYFGDTKNNTVAYQDVEGVKLAFINYNEFAPEGWQQSASTTQSQIKEARRQGYMPVVYAHWGDEYKVVAPERLQTLAHQFVDAGAELVIGSHPHVVEQSEVYKSKYIYYSLGNFIFDQYFLPEVQRGLMVSIVFGTEGVKQITDIPVVLHRDRRTCLEGL